MSLQQLKQAGQAMMLQVSGEPVTLTHAAFAKGITAIVDEVNDPGLPLEGIPAKREFSIVAQVVDLDGVDDTWTATVRGYVRQVLAPAIPDGSGFANIMLGDPLQKVTPW